MHPYSRFDKQRKKKKTSRTSICNPNFLHDFMKLFLTTKERKKERRFFRNASVDGEASFVISPPSKDFASLHWWFSVRFSPSGRVGFKGGRERKETKGNTRATLFYARRGGEKLYLRPCSSKIICWILVDSPPLHSIEYKCEIDIERNYRKKNNIKKWIISIFFEHTFVNIGKKRKRNF